MGDCTVNPESDNIFCITKTRRRDSKNGIIIRLE